MPTHRSRLTTARLDLQALKLGGEQGALMVKGFNTGGRGVQDAQQLVRGNHVATSLRNVPVNYLGGKRIEFESKPNKLVNPPGVCYAMHTYCHI